VSYGPSDRSGELLTLAQAADALGLHPKSVRGLVASGALRVVQLWRTVRIPRADVARFVAKVKYWTGWRSEFTSLATA
jgi:excisionase family DNA binding protein